MREHLSWNSANNLRDSLSNMGSNASTGAAEWYVRDFTTTTSGSTSRTTKHTLRYRTVESTCRFFLGHAGFEKEVVYQPYREWISSDDNDATVDPSTTATGAHQSQRRMYSEMASGDWWWKRQDDIRIPKSTVIPLIVASDKTQVANHTGDLSAHAIYLTVGNLPAHIRNSNERPGCVLLGLIPIVTGTERLDKCRIFQECMRIIFDPVREASDGEGWNIPCSDGWYRRCFPMLAVMAIDYEEQVLITGVKSNRHCSLCTIDPDMREDLEAWAPWRTPRNTHQQLERQRKDKSIARNHRDWVHDVDCFARDHRHVNIHRAMMADLLHQLHKGVVEHTYYWVKDLLYAELPKSTSRRMRAAVEAERQNGRAVQVGKVPRDMITAIIDRRFACIPTYKDMRVFKQLSKATRWSGKEMKSMARQMMPALSPLLRDAGSVEGIRFVRAVVDFTLLASYRSHDEETLGYMTLALFRMNQHKEAFRLYRPRAANTDEGHFNFPKFHAITHYMDLIREYGNCPDVETGHFEHKHVKFVKAPFKNTNKKPGWEDQIMEHHKRWLNMRSQLDLKPDVRPLTSAEKRELAEQATTQPTKAVDIGRFFGWGPGSLTRHDRKDIWRTVAEVEENLGSPIGLHFRQAIAVFVRESRGTSHSTGTNTIRNPERLEPDDEWVLELPVKFHSSIKCWRQTNEDPDDPDALEKVFAQCSPHWQGEDGNGRYDWIWVQEYEATQDQGVDGIRQVAFDGRLPAQLRFVITVKDKAKHGSMSFDTADSSAGSDFTEGTSTEWVGAFVQLYRPERADGLADNDHRMVVIKPVPSTPTQSTLRGRRIYPITGVHHPIHVVPIEEWSDVEYGPMYINNTADFLTYNMLWNEGWEADLAQVACRARDERIRQVRSKRQIESAADGHNPKH